MDNKPVLMIIGTECPPEIEEEWNRWYTEKHVPMVLEFKGIKKATRLKITDDTEGGKYPRYLAIYEFENRQAAEAYDKSPLHQATLKDSNETWMNKGHKRMWRVHYEVIKSWEQ